MARRFVKGLVVFGLGYVTGLIILGLAGLLFYAWIADAASVDTVPDYHAWNCAYRPDFRLACMLPHEVVPELTREIAIEYSDPDSNDPALLVRFVMEWNTEAVAARGKDALAEKLHIRFYDRESNEWRLLDTKELVRAEAPKNVRIELIVPDSPFSKKYIELRKKVLGPDANPGLGVQFGN